MYGLRRLVFASLVPAAPALVAILLLGAAPLAAVEGLRIGDAGVEPDPSRFDPAYPEMERWAQAGLRGGIPPRSASRIAAMVSPGESIQAALDRVGQEARSLVPDAGTGYAGVPVDQRYLVVQLRAGTHQVDESSWGNKGHSNQPRGHLLRVPPGVILRGESRDETVLMVTPPAVEGVPEGRFDGFDAVVSVRVERFAGLEDLTIRNARVVELGWEKVRGTWHRHPGIDAHQDLPVLNGAGVALGRSDSFMQNCAILDSATVPVQASGNNHTLRDNLVQRSWHRGPQGNGYYHTSSGRHSLFYNETVSDVRHVTIQGFDRDRPNRFHVFIHCTFHVDFNFHNGVIGSVLVQDCVTEPAGGHPWGRNTGFQGYKEEFADRNLVYRVSRYGDEVRVIGNPGKSDPQSDPSLTPPKHGTLYAVTGKHIPFELVRSRQDFARLQKEAEGDQPGRVVGDLSGLIANLPAESDERQQAEELQRRLEERGAQEIAQAQENPRQLKSTLQRWRHWEGAAALQEAAEKAAAAELEPLKAAARPRERSLIAIVHDWPGTAAAEEALELYDHQVAEALERLRLGERPDQRAAGLQRFLRQWDAAAPTVAAVTEDYHAAVDQMLTVVLAVEDRRRRDQGLQLIIQRHPESPAAARARAMLER